MPTAARLSPALRATLGTAYWPMILVRLLAPLVAVQRLEHSAGRGIDRRIAITGAAVGAVGGAIGGDLSRKRVCPGNVSPCGPTLVQATLAGAALGAPK